MKSISVSAPGKLHLLGEHVVVYGKPAIIAAVDKRCFVEIIPRKDKKIEIVSRNLKKNKSSTFFSRSIDPAPNRCGIGSREKKHNDVNPRGKPRGFEKVLDKITTEKEIAAKTKDAQVKWETYTKTNDMSLLKSITSDPLDFPIIVIGETLKYFKKSLPCGFTPHRFGAGFTLSIKSDIPIGSGMGSSAALAVSVAGAISLLFNKKLDKEAANEIAFLSEQKKHGLPSGGDNAASCFGGMIWYRKEPPDLKIIKPIPFAFPQKLAKNFIAIHTGTPVESTGEMVSLVRNLYKEKPEFVESILSSQEKLTRELLTAIKNGDGTLMIYIIRAGEKNLESLGVVSSSAKSIIREIEKTGGAAKICGAGGTRKGSGMVLSYCLDKKSVEKLAGSHNFSYINISLGAEGLREE